ncbi:MAG TPA: 6-carboxytetrahydropterin synthase [Candidatus Acidoferrales bacterium]|nr:6-carboxytetrahydropterin synthase [Candidatus Acidoferrales bacterium]
MKISLTRRYSFAASHRLCRPDWSDTDNYRIFGKCANPYGHGHNYLLEVTVTGALDPSTGMIINLADLDAAVKAKVLDEFDHVYLNAQVPEFRDIVPTTENLCRVIFQRLSGVTKARLELIRIQETGRNSFECDAASGSVHENELHAAYQEQAK